MEEHGYDKLVSNQVMINSIILDNTSDWHEYYQTEKELMTAISKYFFNLVVFFIASDEKITQEEAELYTEFTGEDMVTSETVSDINEFYSVACSELGRPPKFLEHLALVDLNCDTDYATRVLYYIFSSIMEIIKIDGELDDLEEDEAMQFFSMLDNYLIEKGVKREYDDERNIVNSGTDSAESSSQVDTSVERKSIDELISEFQKLVGLDRVKSEVSTLTNFIKISKMREARGLKIPPLSLHLVFSGNPGTGKTTVARILGGIYKSLGVLSKGHLVEVDRSSLVAGYVGQTAIKTKEVLNDAMGGILFIDEAYSLTDNGNSDYGQEAIDTILKFMEDNRDDFVLIVAGYTQKMESFLNSNPGLRSRFNKMIQFDDYDPEALVKIFLRFSEDHQFNIEKKALIKIHDFFVTEYKLKDNNFANGRLSRNIFEKIIEAQSNRLAVLENLSNEDLSLITLEDVNTAM